jgi:hypothetical protein
LEALGIKAFAGIDNRLRKFGDWNVTGFVVAGCILRHTARTPSILFLMYSIETRLNDSIVCFIKLCRSNPDSEPNPVYCGEWESRFEIVVA